MRALKKEFPAATITRITENLTSQSESCRKRPLTLYWLTGGEERICIELSRFTG
jgi:hypothetical protein